VSLPHVVIIGGGFGGLAAAHALSNAPVRITLVDRRNYHLFQPLLYQVATAALSASDIARPIRRILHRQANSEVILGEAESIDRFARKVILVDGEIGYDYLIIARGATHSYFGHDAWERDAPGLKTLEDALEIRRRVLVAYEAAEREPDPEIAHEWMTFVIVGAGVELAGALAEISRRVLARDFRRIDPRRARIILIEGTTRVLPALTPESSVSALRQLEHLGVEVMTSAMVTGIDDRGVMHAGGRIPTRTVIWAAGVAASPLGKSLGVPLDRAGRVIVNPDLSVPRRAGRVRDWGPGLDSQVGWQTGSRPGSRRYAGRTARRAQCDACDSGRAFGAVWLHRQGHAGDDRPRRGSRGDRTA
jgi:NADH dehydrogenase